MEHIVTGCNDCPFLETINDICKATGMVLKIKQQEESDKYVVQYEVPNNCPLNKEPITIIKK